MRTIVVINDNTPHAVHAAEAALAIAQTCKANLLLANLVAQNETLNAKASVTHGYNQSHDSDENITDDLASHLKMRQVTAAGYKPRVTNLNAVNLTESELADVLNKHNVWMVIHGCGDMKLTADISLIDPFILLNLIKCPLVFMPLTYHARVFQRIVYMTDLRYCQPSVVRYMAEFAKPYASNLLLGHLSASGLPDMALDYALSLFKETVGTAVKYNQLAFSNIKERDVKTAIDVLVQGMHTDMLVVVNHQYHFKQVLGNLIALKQLPQTPVPIMVFPF